MKPTTITEQDSASHYARIRQIGKTGRILCSALMVVIALFVLVMLILTIFSHSPSVMGVVSIKPFGMKELRPASLSNAEKIGFIAYTLLGCTIMLTGIWLMRRLFVLFEKGDVFTKGIARLLMWLGVWNLIMVFSGDCSSLLTGLCLLALGRVMELAVSLKEEQSLTV